MKYCTNCGKPLAPDERFCTNCGKENRDYHEFSRSEILHKRTSMSPWKLFGWSLFGLVILGLIIGGAYLAFYFYSGGFGNIQQSANHTEQTTHSNIPETDKVSVNVNSTEFSQNFMKSPNTHGYNGFEMGQSKSDVQNTFGNPEGKREIHGNKVELYGNMGVSYDNDDKVNHVFVIPSHMSESEFTTFHNGPDINKGNIWYYDTLKDNGFSIKVYTNNNMIEAIENIPQI
ncbi:zinc-ribbon domain-containing protein [Staphylococcus simulans]|uniref:zinc-ribbon domain-containing protein n=1 Tax=Staphylococcus simulans TaxID=1286 RepID=UPI00399AF78F